MLTTLTIPNEAKERNNVSALAYFDAVQCFDPLFNALHQHIAKFFHRYNISNMCHVLLLSPINLCPHTKMLCLASLQSLELRHAYPPTHTPAFSPRSKIQLKNAVDACLKLSPKGICPKGPHGAIATWDVSRVTDMSRMFAHAKVFDSDISKWDVSRVNNMRSMFLGATSFNGDLSRWDVSNVNDMRGMFLGATVFKRQLCGSAWVRSKAKQSVMFEGTSGSISRTACAMSTGSQVFSPQSGTELKSAVDEYLESDGNVGPNGPIGE